MFGRRLKSGGPVQPARPEMPDPKPIPPHCRWMVHYQGDSAATMVDAHRLEFQDGVAIFTTYTESTWRWGSGVYLNGWIHHFQRAKVYVGSYRTIIPVGRANEVSHGGDDVANR